MSFAPLEKLPTVLPDAAANAADFELRFDDQAKLKAVLDAAEVMVSVAERMGIVLTIERRAARLPAPRTHETVISVHLHRPSNKP